MLEVRVDRMEQVGAVILAAMIILGAEVAVLGYAFGGGQTLLVTGLSSALSLVLGSFLVLSPSAGRGRRGALSAIIGGVVTVSAVSLMPREVLKGGAATALAICLMSCLWVVPHMAGLELLSRLLDGLKSRAT